MPPISYARYRFPPVIIQHAVWLYLRFTLSYRDVEGLLAERGLDISYETVRRWELKFGSIAWLLKRPVGRPPHEVRRYHASFSYRAGSWTKPRRVVAKVEWHPGELYPRVGFIVTDMRRPAERMVAFYNQRGTAERWIREGKNAVTWTRLSCRRFAANAVRLHLPALAYNLGNFLRTLALPDAAKQWSMTTLRQRLGNIGARIARHGRSITFQMAEVMVSRILFRQILAAIAALRPSPPARC